MARNAARLMISLPPELLATVTRIAEEEDRSVSSIFRLALAAYLAEREEAEVVAE